MRLTMWLARTKPHGYLFRGKYRLVKQVQVPELRKRVQEFETEEKNMLILRHPYLTVEQSKCHMQEIKKKNTFSENQNSTRNRKFARTYTWAEQLSHIRIKDCWD